MGNSKRKLYNRNVCWNDDFDYITNIEIFEKSQQGITYSKHYSNAVCDRIIGKYASVESLLTGTVIEVEFVADKIEKAVIRNTFDNRRDVITVIRFTDKGLLFVTAWLNTKTNNHESLDTAQYELFL